MMPSSKNLTLTPQLYEYLLAQNPPLSPAQRRVIKRTREAFPAKVRLQMAEEQGPFLAFLVRLTKARNIVEVGTFTGFSTLSMAEALPDGGRIITCDESIEWTAVGRECWKAAGVDGVIDLRLGDAIETLRQLPYEKPWIDLSFIDADKLGYPLYWEELVKRTRIGGLIIADNTLFHGDVADPATGGGGASIRAFNDVVQRDQRVDAVLLSVADGVTLARRVS